MWLLFEFYKNAARLIEFDDDAARLDFVVMGIMLPLTERAYKLLTEQFVLKRCTLSPTATNYPLRLPW